MAAALLTMLVSQKNRGARKAVAGYASDASAVLVKFDESKVPVAGSPDFYTAKDSGSIFDVIFTSDLATPTHVQFQINGSPVGDILDVTAQLASVVSRASINIPVNAGDKIGLMQLA